MATPRSTEARNFGLTILGIWFLAALAVGASDILPTLRRPAPPIIIASLTTFALVLALRVSPLREWVARLDPRWLVAVHLTRFVGFYFLVLYDRGALPRAFGLYGGWGDIAVATLAVLLLLLTGPVGNPPDRMAYALWNIFGLVDILFVVLAALRAFASDANSMAPLLRLPLSLLPTFAVPLIITTHVLLFLRLRPARPTQPPSF